MRRTRTVPLAAVALAALVLSAAPAEAGRGFVAKQPLRRVTGSGETEARGGFTAWFRVRNDHSTVQGITIWVQGLSDSEGATVWVARPDDAEASEVADLAVTENGSGMWEVVVDSNRDDGAELPLGVESVLKLAGGVIQVRLPSGEADDFPVLRATVGDFDFRDIQFGQGGDGVKSRRTSLRRPPEPAIPPDEAASGTARLWRKKARGPGDPGHEGLAVFARGLTEDDTYEVWIEDGAGALQEIGALDSTTGGLGFFSIDSRAEDVIPPELDAEGIRDLSGRRLELRRQGFTDYSLATVLPRLR
jgi:hypothetical protein